MPDKNIEKLFDIAINKISSGHPNPDKSINECMSLLREMNSTPYNKLGEVQPILNEKIDSFCKATGKSYESVLMEMSMAKPKFK